MWFSFVLDDYDDLNWREEMAAMFTLLDKLGITVEKVTCHHFSGDRRFLGTDPEPNAKLAKSIQHCSRVEHGTLTLHLNLFGFGQIERSWDGFKFKSSFPTSFCWHLASTSSPFLGVFESQQIARSLPGTGAPWLRSSPCAPYDAGWRGWCCWRRFRRRPRWWRRWRRWNWGRSWPQRRGSCLELGSWWLGFLNLFGFFMVKAIGFGILQRLYPPIFGKDQMAVPRTLLPGE